MRRHILGPEIASGGEPAPMLALRQVHAAYGQVEVLRGVDLVARAGEIIALLGPNGAGKTTTLRVASGRMRTTSGEVSIDGTDIRRIRPEKLARSGVCSIPEGRGVFPNLTVEENLRMWSFRADGVAKAETVAFDRFPRLKERRRQLAGSLSGGEQQMLAMARALVGEQRLLLLDEISMGLAPLVVSELYELVSSIAAEGCAVVLVEQFASAALSVAHGAAVMAGGRIELVGSPDTVRSAVSDIYLRG